MGRRVFPVVLVSLAACADYRGSSRIAFDLLLVAVPCAAYAALSAFGAFLDEREAPAAALQALGWTLVAGLLTLSCAVRSSAVHDVPPIAFSAVFACLGVFALQLAVPFVRGLFGAGTAEPAAAGRLRDVSEMSQRQRAA